MFPTLCCKRAATNKMNFSAEITKEKREKNQIDFEKKSYIY